MARLGSAHCMTHWTGTRELFFKVWFHSVPVPLARSLEDSSDMTTVSCPDAIYIRD